MIFRKNIIKIALSLFLLALVSCHRAPSLINDFYKLSDKEAYDYVENSQDAWCVKAYDLVTSSNIKQIIDVRQENDKLRFNLKWPIYGGYKIDTIKSIKELSGIVEVSRDGGDSGHSMCMGKNLDGSEYTDSQRSVPKSSSIINIGNLNIDLYNKACEAIIGHKDEGEILQALEDEGFTIDQCKDLFESYNKWLTRTENIGKNNIQEGIKKANLNIAPDYGYYGSTAPWIIGNLNLEGGSVQMNTVFSWGVLKSTNLLTNIHQEKIN